jgi:hypothetical protein
MVTNGFHHGFRQISFFRQLALWKILLTIQSRKEDFTLNFLPNTIDISKVQTLLYHFLDGQVLQLEIKNIDQLAALEFEVGRFCDTTEINGILHFYPRGNS